MLVVEKVSSALEMSGIMVYEHPLFGKVRMYVEMVKVGFAEWILPLLYSIRIHQKQL